MSSFGRRESFHLWLEVGARRRYLGVSRFVVVQFGVLVSIVACSFGLACVWFARVEVANEILVVLSLPRPLICTPLNHHLCYSLVRGYVFTHVSGRIGKCQRIGLAIVLVALF